MSPEEDALDSVIQDDLSAFLRKVNPMALGTAGLGGVYRDIGDNAAKSNIAVDTVSAALAGGMNLFDTAPWYANSEYVLGDALAKASPQRSDYFIATKVGRYPTSDLEKPHGDFDYSPARICESVASSLEKLQTNYLDIVYLHDVEFVHHEPGVIRKALLALRELQKVKKVKLIGICGYPLEVLDQIVDTCGELIQIVQSHCRLTLQNDSLLEKAAKWSEKGIAVSNAAVLAMGLLTSRGPPDWHPASPDLKAACKNLSSLDFIRAPIEEIAIRWSLNIQRQHPRWIAATVIGCIGVAEVSAAVESGKTSNEIDPQFVVRIRKALGDQFNATWNEVPLKS